MNLINHWLNEPTPGWGFGADWVVEGEDGAEEPGGGVARTSGEKQQN